VKKPNTHKDGGYPKEQTKSLFFRWQKRTKSNRHSQVLEKKKIINK
jgi:hypothetical protein